MRSIGRCGHALAGGRREARWLVAAERLAVHRELGCDSSHEHHERVLGYKILEGEGVLEAEVRCAA